MKFILVYRSSCETHIQVMLVDEKMAKLSSLVFSMSVHRITKFTNDFTKQHRTGQENLGPGGILNRES